MKVVLTEAAYDDLAKIGRYIKRDNPHRSATFVRELYSRCRQLGQMPYAYPLLPNHEDRGIRRRVYGSYLIFYRVVGDNIDVVHILHGAQDYETILFPED